MWAYGQHLRIQKLDDLRSIEDSCVVASFEQQSRASNKNNNMIEDELGYAGVIQAIYEVNFRVLKQVFINKLSLSIEILVYKIKLILKLDVPGHSKSRLVSS